MIDPIIKQYATQRQVEFIDAINSTGTRAKAAKQLGINIRTLERGIPVSFILP